MARRVIENESGDGELGRMILRAGDHWIGVGLSSGTVTLSRVYEPDTASETLIAIQDGAWTASEVRLVRVAAPCTVAIVGSGGAADVSLWRE